MNKFDFSPAELVLPTALVLAGLALGLLFEAVLLKRLKRLTTHTKWPGDEIVIGSLQGIGIIWCFTGGIYAAVVRLPLDPLLFKVIVKLLLITTVLSAAVVAARIGAGFVGLHSRRLAPNVLSASIFSNIIRFTIILLGVLVALQVVGISITPLLTALGIGGLAVALALQETLSNLFAGIHIAASRQLRPGDYIKLDTGEEGYIADITWRNTTIRSLANNIVVVPNAKMSQAKVTNFDLPESETALVVEIGVAYGSDLEKVERVTVEVARESMKEITGGIPAFEPFIRFHTFGDFRIQFTVILRVRRFVDHYAVRHEFLKRLAGRYQKEGIEIPLPSRTIQVREGKVSAR